MLNKRLDTLCLIGIIHPRALNTGLALKTQESGSLKKEYQINYHRTWQTVSKMVFPTMAMISSVLLIKFFVPYEVMSKASCLLYILINASVGALCYLVFAHKLGLINKILGEHLINNILRKVTFGKYPKNNKAV